MHTEHAGVQLICSRECTLSHQGVADRCLDAVCQFAHFLGRAGDDTAAAHENIRALRLLDQRYDVIQAFFCNSLSKRFNFLRSLRLVLIRCCCDIFCNIDQNRARSSALCDRERTAQGVCKNRDIFYDHTVFCDRHRNACDVNLLKAVFSKQRLSYVAGDGYHRGGVHVSRCNSGDKVCRTRAARCHTYACFSGRTRISVCRMGCSLLVGGQDVVDFRVAVKLIVDI